MRSICFVLLLSVFGLSSANANPAQKTQDLQTKPNVPKPKSTQKTTQNKKPTQNPQASQDKQAQNNVKNTKNTNPATKQDSAKQDLPNANKTQKNPTQPTQKQLDKLAAKEAKKQAKIQAMRERNAPPKNLYKRNLQKALSFSPFYLGIPSLLELDELEKIAQSNPQKLRDKTPQLEEVCEGSEVDFVCASQKEIEIFYPHIKLSNLSQHFKLFPDTLQVELNANVSSEFLLDILPFHTASQKGEFEKILPKYFKDILTIKKDGASVSYDYRVDFASEQGTLLALVLQGSASNPFYEHKSLAEFLLDFMVSVNPKSIDYAELCQNLNYAECNQNIARKKAQFSITLFSPKNLKAVLSSQDFSDTLYAIYAIDVANKARISDRQTYKKDIQDAITKESQVLRKNLINDKMPINTHSFALDFLSAFGGFFLDSERLGFEIKASEDTKEKLLLRDFVENSGRLRDFLSTLQFSVIR